jgi:hypothetical protein
MQADEPHGVIRIESTRGRDPEHPVCVVTWDGLDKIASVADVRQTAEDLFTCAAYAELIGELLRTGIEAHIITTLIMRLLQSRSRRFFGTRSTLFLLPAGSSKDRAGAVAIGRRNVFHAGMADGVMTPVEACEMGRDWLEAAEATESDSLFGTLLHRSLRLSDLEIDSLFHLVQDIRAGTAGFPPEPPDYPPLPRL